jgi:putative addiction module component (TIGR02574 family)
VLDALREEYSREEEARELSAEEIAELDQRMAAYRADPSSAVDSDLVFARMRERIAASK